MALQPGTKLGPYEIVALLGAGGMGEVYRARDTRLNRTVAIKVIAAHLSDNAEAKERFDREARAISSLNHPNICALFDIGHQNGIDFIVLEFLEGQTLAQRLIRGPLPLDQALRYGIGICEGLERAHRSGVIHRDLKPANIMLTKTGLKLMDFGLAKAPDPSRGHPSDLMTTVSSPDASGLTSEGTIVGTFHYMSPEQVEGKGADARSDIFSFGAMLYEMTTGTKAFDGITVASVIAAVLDKNPPPVSRSHPDTPELLDRTIQICLAKDPDERWQTVHDLRLQMQGINQTFGVPFAARIQANRSSLARVRGLWGSVAILLLVTSAVAVFLMSHTRSREPYAPAVRAFLMPPTDFLFSSGGFALSPDGTKIVFVATSASDPKGILWVQDLNSMKAHKLAGTEDVEDSGHPFWSYDSAKIGFFSQGKLKRVEANGGIVTTLAEARNSHGGAWSQNDFIVFSKGESENELLYRVSAAGADEKQITIADKHHLRDVHRWPSFLPDGHHVFFTCAGTEEFYRDGELFVGTKETGCTVDSNSMEQLPALGPTSGQYVKGSLLYIAGDGTLTAEPFDISKMAFIGERQPIAERINYFSVSLTGVLAYINETKSLSQLVWRSREGKMVEAVEPVGTYDGVALSHDGMRVVTTHYESPNGMSLWIHDVGRVSASLFNNKNGFNIGENHHLIWSRDGAKVAYASNVPPGDICIQPSDGSPAYESLFKKLSPAAMNTPIDFSPDGRLLLYINSSGKTGSRLWVHPLAKGSDDYALLGSDSPEGEAQFSPDGRWLAYVSEETGRPEVFVAAFPDLSSRIQVSTSGGNQPRWRRDGKEIFFVAPDGKMTAVLTEARGNILKAGVPHELFQTEITGVSHSFYQYDVTANGQKFVINTRVKQAVQPITVYINWDTATKKQ